MTKKKAMELDRLALIEVVKNTPLVAIDLIVKNAQNEVLLGLRNNEPAKNFWFVPGGRIFKDERIGEAFERIAHDELGADLALQNAHFLGVFEHLYQENFAQEPGFGTHYVVLVYEVELSESLHGLPKDQHYQYRWFKTEVLLKAEDVHPNTKVYFETPPLPSDSGLYCALMSHYLHYDRQMWSRTQILLSVQGAALVGGYNLRSVWLGPFIMISAFFLVLVIWGLIKRDEQNRDFNIEVMDELAERDKQKLKLRLPKEKIKLRSDPLWWLPRGRTLINLVVIVLLIIDFVLAGLYWFKPEFFPAVR